MKTYKLNIKIFRMLKKNVSKQHIQIFKTRWLKDEQHYKTLIENVSLKYFFCYVLVQVYKRLFS